MSQRTDTSNLFVDLFATPDAPAVEKPIYNHFMHAHGTFEGTSTLSPYSDHHLEEWPILEFNGYIPVVHEPTYIDMGNYIHFNPSPVFVPAPTGMALLGVAALVLSIRTRR